MTTKRIDPKSIDEQAILEIVAGKNEHIGTTISDVQTSHSVLPQSVAPLVEPAPQPKVSADRITAYETEFLYAEALEDRKSLHISGELHRRIVALTGIAGTRATVSGFVNRVLEHHFREYGTEIMTLLDRYYQSFKHP